MECSSWSLDPGVPLDYLTKSASMPSGDTFRLFGGRDNFGVSKKIYEFVNEEMFGWKLLDTSMEEVRSAHVAIPLPDDNDIYC